MTPLLPPDSHHLQAAQGWLELQNVIEANEELEKIMAPLRGHPDVLVIRWHIYAKAKNWDACLDIASALVRLVPERPDSWIHRSFAFHSLHRTQEAYENLLPAADLFYDIWQIPYNLACYCAQLDQMDEAKEWFKKAVAIDDKAVPNVGIDDPDLKPLWDSLSTVWRNEPLSDQ